MKTKTIYITICTLLFLTTSPVCAKDQDSDDENSSRKNIRIEFKEKIDSKRTEIKKEIEEFKKTKQESREKKLDDNSKEKVQKQIGLIYTKLQAKIVKLSKIDSDLTRKIAVRTSYSGTSSAETIATIKSLQLASQDLLVKARVDVEGTKITIDREVSSTTTKEVIRLLVKKAEESIKTTAESYKKVADLLKTIKKPEDRTFSTTTTTTTR